MQKRKPPELNFMNLLLGLLLGFFLGGGLMYLNSNRQNDSLVVNYFQSFYEKSQQTFKPKFVKNYIPQNNLDSLIISTGNKLRDTGKYRYDSVLKNPIVKDAALADSKDNVVGKNYSEIEQEASISDKKAGIITDKLLGVKAVIFEMEKPKISESTRELDSLLGNIPSRRKVPENLFYFEFWESPINFQGYKMINNKIILYGLASINATSFKIYKNDIYINYHNEVYLIKETDVFLPLIPITDAFLINQIENQW
jgi:hypothetical protein